MQEQGLVVIKENFLTRLTKRIRRFFFKEKINDLLDNDYKQEIDFVEANEEFVEQEIVDARRAYRKYVINNNKNISTDVLSYICQKLEENEEKIKQIININNDNITYQRIAEMVINEKQQVLQFKCKNQETGRFNVPFGVIGIECDNVEDSIKAMLKAISTRNSIIILHNNFSKYSTESLILLIFKECLKNYFIDDNIIQMFEKQEIDISKLDKLIEKDGVSKQKDIEKTIYIYQENDEFRKKVVDEIDRLKNSELYNSYEIKPIKGEFGQVINYLSNNESSAICMYTNNTQKAYKFINWVNSPNVFVNTGVLDCRANNSQTSEFFNSKYVLHEDVF